MREIEINVKKDDTGKEIRDILRNFGVSSALLKKLKMTENGITKNGVFAKSIEIVNENDIIKIKIFDLGTPPKKSDIPLDVIYEDKDLIAVNKPPFMPVHESRNHQGDALSNAVSFYLDEPITFRSIYRLDRDTSGIVLIAKNEFAAAKLSGKIKKDYYGIVCGKIENDGTVDAPIARVDDSIIEREVSPYGERAITHYEVISSNENFSLLKFLLETGRTHQIRVHMNCILHPLVGDTLYGKENHSINRQALHCKTIYFNHPITEKEIILDTPFPNDFKGLI